MLEMGNMGRGRPSSLPVGAVAASGPPRKAAVTFLSAPFLGVGVRDSRVKVVSQEPVFLLHSVEGRWDQVPSRLPR